MARKTDIVKRKGFTKNIHSTRRTGTRFSGMNNHNEKLAKVRKDVCCHDCRFFDNGCYEFIGRYHKPCNEFEWW